MADNPTRTITIEKAWRLEIARRWRKFGRLIIEELKRLNDQIIVNKAVGINATQTRAYMSFVQQQINDLLLVTDRAPNWEATYQLQAYQRSLEMFGAQLRAQGETAAANALETRLGQTLSGFTSVASLSAGVGSLAPIHRDALEFVFNRGYESLNGWTDKLAMEIRQSVFNAVEEGQGVAELSRNILKRVEVSKSRANLIAQTEVNQAYGIAQINEARRASELLGEPVGLRWLTRRDDLVRHQHAIWHGTVSDPDETARRKQVSPFNCRCGLAPVVEGANTEAKKKKFAKERKELLELEKKKPALPKKKPAKPKPKPLPKAKPKPKPTGTTKPRNIDGAPKGLNNADVETQAFFDNSFTDPKYDKLTASIDAPSDAGIVDEGAWFFNGSINMGKYSPATPQGQSVYRHEFGHHFDDQRGMLSATKEYEAIRVLDEKIIIKKAQKFHKEAKAGRYSKELKGERYSASNVKMSFRRDANSVMDEFNAAGETFDKWATNRVKKGGIAEKFLAIVKETGRIEDSARFMTGIIAAEETGFDLGYALSIWNGGGSWFLRNQWREAGQVADLVGALTNEKFGGGHGKHYYFERKIYYHEGQTVEMFAQIFSLNNAAGGDLGAIMSEMFSPNGTAFFKGLL